jgi:hypothetical protein
MPVYFIQAKTGEIKIGHAVNVAMRMRAIQSCSPCKLELIATVNGGIKEETAIHNHFSADRLHGEWFLPSRALLEFADMEDDERNEFAASLRRKRHAARIATLQEPANA